MRTSFKESPFFAYFDAFSINICLYQDEHLALQPPGPDSLGIQIYSKDGKLFMFRTLIFDYPAVHPFYI